MDIIKYEIKRGDTLESIAEQNGISIKELVDFHNKNCGITQQIIGDYIPINVVALFISQEKLKKEKNIEFDHKTRYRCEQLNTTKVEKNITFHCNTKKEYTLETNEKLKTAKVVLKEFLYKINPQNLSTAIEATKELEYDKENVVFLLDDSKKISNILNFEEIKEKWKNFEPKLKNSEFYQQIAKINVNAAEDIIKGGELEFENEINLLKTYNKNLFYHVIFNDYVPSSKSKSLQFLSQIFVDVHAEVELKHSIIKEDDYFVEYRTVGTLLTDKLDLNKIIDQYNEFYKPIIEYGFSEYKYAYRVRRRVEKKTGLVTDATAMMKEEVKNNYQLITQFDLRNIDY